MKWKPILTSHPEPTSQRTGSSPAGRAPPTAVDWRLCRPLQEGDSRVHKLHLQQDLSPMWTFSPPNSLKTEPSRPGEWASEANTFPKTSEEAWRPFFPHCISPVSSSPPPRDKVPVHTAQPLAKTSLMARLAVRNLSPSRTPMALWFTL